MYVRAPRTPSRCRSEWCRATDHHSRLLFADQLIEQQQVEAVALMVIDVVT